MNIPLLCQLREAGGRFVPLAELNDRPAPDRVLSDLEELLAFGFAIERHPYLGVAYRGPADRLCPDQIEHQLGTSRIGRRIAVWNRVASTNDLAAQAASSSSNEGLVVLAEEQTDGRGRRGRAWSSPPRSSILMSVLLFPDGPLAEPAWLTALGAVSVAEVVSEWSGQAASIKWPNDVRVNGRKVAGILVERAAGAVIGIGVNANLTADDLPEELRDKATSVETLVGSRIDRSEFARDLIRRLDARYSASEAEGSGVLSGPWRDLSEHLNTSVEVDTPSGPARGRLVDIDLTNGLRLVGRDGKNREIPIRHVLSIAPG